MLNELIAAIYAILAGDSTLAASGIKPTDGTSRTVAIVGQGKQNTAIPFVRVTLTDDGPLEPDAIPHDYTTQPTAERVMLLLNVFSDHEPEVRKIAARLKVLLRHRQITTAGFGGYTWIDSTTYYTDNLSEPDRVLRVAALRIRCSMEAN